METVAPTEPHAGRHDSAAAAVSAAGSWSGATNPQANDSLGARTGALRWIPPAGAWLCRRHHPFSPALLASLPGVHWLDRKSTRLNSSHANISYAVFCLKKKT